MDHHRRPASITRCQDHSSGIASNIPSEIKLDIDDLSRRSQAARRVFDQVPFTSAKSNPWRLNENWR